MVQGYGLDVYGWGVVQQCIGCQQIMDLGVGVEVECVVVVEIGVEVGQVLVVEVVEVDCVG